MAGISKQYHRMHIASIRLFYKCSIEWLHRTRPGHMIAQSKLAFSIPSPSPYHIMAWTQSNTVIFPTRNLIKFQITQPFNRNRRPVLIIILMSRQKPKLPEIIIPTHKHLICIRHERRKQSPSRHMLNHFVLNRLQKRRREPLSHRISDPRLKICINNSKPQLPITIPPPPKNPSLFRKNQRMCLSTSRLNNLQLA